MKPLPKRSAVASWVKVVRPRAQWSELSLPGAQITQLKQIVNQAKAGVTPRAGETALLAGWNARFAGGSALFAGPDGTGKTLAAEVVASKLGRPLYRIDLAAVVGKYIGETEKNLRRLFDAAEAGGAVLLLDEADALFGKRSNVRDSHDRYANIEVNYLLQRVEAHQGLVILATNLKANLDPAFLRRLRFIVEFPPPQPPPR